MNATYHKNRASMADEDTQQRIFQLLDVLATVAANRADTRDVQSSFGNIAKRRAPASSASNTG